MKKYFAGKSFELTCAVLGMSVNEILTKSGIELRQSALADFPFSAAEVAQFHSTIISEYEGDDIHIKVANGHVGHIYGTGELAFIVSSTLGEALQRMTKLKAWVKPLIWEIKNTDNTLKVVIKPAEVRYPMGGLVEIACFIYLVQTFRYHTKQKIDARHIQITEPVPYLDQIGKELGCKIKIADSCALTFDASVGSIPLTPPHSFLSERVDDEIKRQNVEDSSKLECSHSFTVLTKQKIRENLIHDFSSDSISKSLGVSKRTFERRLFEENTSYRKVLEETRAEFALELLAHPENTLAEISYQLGFKEPNSFLRAFKRWNKVSPSEYKNAEKSLDVAI